MVVQRCYAREVTRSQNTTTQRDDARFSGKRRCGYLQKQLDGSKLEVLTEVCFAVSVRVAVGAGDGDEESTEGNDVQKTEERRLGESILGQLDRGNAWKKGVVAKSGAGDVATSSKCRRTHQTSLRAKVVWAADLLGEELGEGSAAHFVRGKARPPPTTRPRLPKVRTRQARLFCYCHSTRTRTTTPPPPSRCCAPSPHAPDADASDCGQLHCRFFATRTAVQSLADVSVSPRYAPRCSHCCGLHGASLGAEALPFVLSWRVSSLVRLHAEAHGLPFVGRIHQKRPLTLSFIARLADVLPRAPEHPASSPSRPTCPPLKASACSPFGVLSKPSAAELHVSLRLVADSAAQAVTLAFCHSWARYGDGRRPLHPLPATAVWLCTFARPSTEAVARLMRDTAPILLFHLPQETLFVPPGCLSRWNRGGRVRPSASQAPNSGADAQTRPFKSHRGLQTFAYPPDVTHSCQALILLKKFRLHLCK